MRGAAGLAAAVSLACASAAAAEPRPEIVRTEPGSAPAAPAAAPAAATSVLTYAALGLSGLAAVLGGSALAVALAGARRTEALSGAVQRRPAPADDPRTSDRIARLEAALRTLDEAAARRAPPAAPPSTGRDPLPQAARTAPPRPGPPSASAPPSVPTSADRVSEWVEALQAAFARLALDPSSAAAAFITDHRPHGALAGPDGVALLDGFEGAKLWAMRAPGEAEVWALTPGEQAVMNWSAHFAPHRTRVAAEVFGEAFDLAEGGAGLRLEAAALVARDRSGRLAVRRRGRLSGFRG